MLDSQKRVFSWGFGGYGRLGHAEQKDEMVPRLVKLFDFPGRGAAQIYAGYTCSFAVSETGGNTGIWECCQRDRWGSGNAGSAGEGYQRDRWGSGIGNAGNAGRDVSETGGNLGSGIQECWGGKLSVGQVRFPGFRNAGGSHALTGGIPRNPGFRNAGG